jgi:collagenase-like PrtC family protease
MEVSHVFPMQLTLGPIQYYWPREKVFAFYQQVCTWPVSWVYLGETVCLRRHELRLADWLAIAEDLRQAGKTPVLSTPALLESETDLKSLRALVGQETFLMEANDFAAVRLLAGRPFVAGSLLNVYNSETLAWLADIGAVRWVLPLEMSRANFGKMQLPDEMETEIFAFGRLPLA